MARILFGEKYDWAAGIRATLDPARFACDFGPPAALQAEHDLFVPLCLRDYDGLRLNPEVLRRCLAPRAEVVALCQDKLAFNRFLIRAGLGRYVPRLLDAPLAAAPFVIKPRWGEWGLGVKVIPSSDAGLDAADRAQLAEGQAFLQTYAPGAREFALHVAARDGVLIWSRLIAHEMGAESHMGQTRYVKGRDRQPLSSYAWDQDPGLGVFAEILARLGYEGTGCFDFKLGPEGPLIFEFNPRPGASIVTEVNSWIAVLLESVQAKP
jgi:carbamoylphosphate synthase large subunit